MEYALGEDGDMYWFRETADGVAKIKPLSNDELISFIERYPDGLEGGSEFRDWMIKSEEAAHNSDEVATQRDEMPIDNDESVTDGDEEELSYGHSYLAPTLQAIMEEPEQEEEDIAPRFHLQEPVAPSDIQTIVEDSGPDEDITPVVRLPGFHVPSTPDTTTDESCRDDNGDDADDDHTDFVSCLTPPNTPEMDTEIHGSTTKESCEETDGYDADDENPNFSGHPALSTGKTATRESWEDDDGYDADVDTDLSGCPSLSTPKTTAEKCGKNDGYDADISDTDSPSCPALFNPETTEEKSHGDDGYDTNADNSSTPETTADELGEGIAEGGGSDSSSCPRLLTPELTTLEYSEDNGGHDADHDDTDFPDHPIPSILRKIMKEAGYDVDEDNSNSEEFCDQQESDEEDPTPLVRSPGGASSSTSHTTGEESYEDGDGYDPDDDDTDSEGYHCHPQRPRLTHTGLENAKWALESWIDQTGHMYLYRDKYTDYGRLHRCTWVTLTAPDQLSKGTGPELTLTTPEGENFWLTDIATYSYDNSSWADDNEEDMVEH
ncbi:hypothetical protein OQA88_7686 [Cercophora sp. LCS_1]